MREPYTQLYVHLVWSTWDRQPLMSPVIKVAVYTCIKAECITLKAEALAVGGTADHVHVLVRIPSTVSIAELVKQIKGASSHLVTHTVADAQSFKWQGAYGAFTVSKPLVSSVRSYILRQEDHHKAKTTDRNMEVAWDPEE